VSHPYRPETDQVEKAQQEAIEQIQLESRLARARPATIDRWRHRCRMQGCNWGSSQRQFGLQRDSTE